MSKTDISIKFGNLVLKNPVMPASGTYDYFDCNANVFPMDKLGAIVLKTVHYQKRMGNPGPRVTEVLGGMLNAVGIPSVGMETFMPQLARYRELNTPVIVSIAGQTPEEFIEFAKRLNDSPYLDAVELNLACPNIGSGLTFGIDPVLLGRTLEGVRTVLKLPLIAKISPNVTDICIRTRVCEECGVDAINIANAVMGMKIDIHTQRPVLGNRMGGFSGPAIKPIIMRHVFQAFESVKMPIIACGGIATWEDAIEFILAGASAVQVGAANFVNPHAMTEIIAGIEKYLEARNARSIADIKGKAH